MRGAPMADDTCPAKRCNGTVDWMASGLEDGVPVQMGECDRCRRIVTRTSVLEGQESLFGDANG